MWIICVMSIFVIVVFSIFYHELMIYAFDEDTAKLKKVKSSVIQFVFTLLTAGAVAVASKIIGALLVSSMMVIPVACALQIAKSYKETLLYSIAFAFTSPRKPVTLTIFPIFIIHIINCNFPYLIKASHRSRPLADFPQPPDR